MNIIEPKEKLSSVQLLSIGTSNRGQPLYNGQNVTILTCPYNIQGSTITLNNIPTKWVFSPSNGNSSFFTLHAFMTKHTEKVSGTIYIF